MMYEFVSQPIVFWSACMLIGTTIGVVFAGAIVLAVELADSEARHEERTRNHDHFMGRGR